MFVSALARGEIQRALLRMGNSARNLDLKSGRAVESQEYDDTLTEDDIAFAATYPTNLCALQIAAFDKIARHGHEVAKRTLTTHVSKYFK